MHAHRFLEINDNSGEVYYLGYPLKLTKSECGVLSAVAQSENGVGKEELVAFKRMRKIGSQNAAVHVCRINKKAKEIGGRPLILFDEGKYFLNEYM